MTVYISSIVLRTGAADDHPRLHPAAADDETGEVSALNVQARRDPEGIEEQIRAQ